MVPADSQSARWEVDVRVVADADGLPDFRGPAAHGKRGERFLYVTWANIDAVGSDEVFRRGKLMLSCARFDPPAIDWSVVAISGRAMQ